MLAESRSAHEFADAQVGDFRSQIFISNDLAGRKIFDWCKRQEAQVLTLRPAPVGFFTAKAMPPGNNRRASQQSARFRCAGGAVGSEGLRLRVAKVKPENVPESLMDELVEFAALL